jgi:plastocyanin
VERCTDFLRCTRIQILTVTPTALGIRGGTVVNFTGSGFSNVGPENQIMIGNLSCSVIAATFTELSCFAPPATLDDLDAMCWGGTDCGNATTTTVTPGTVHQVSWGYDVSAASITIAAGDTVQWNWDQSSAPGFHNLESGTRASPTLEFSCPYQYAGSCSHTFTASGSYPYHCDPHGTMNAIISVASRRDRRDEVPINAALQIRVFNYSPDNATSDGAWGNWIGGVYDGYDAGTADYVTETLNGNQDGAWGGWSNEISTLLRDTKYYGCVGLSLKSYPHLSSGTVGRREL